MNIFKKAALLTLVFANCASYASQSKLLSPKNNENIGWQAKLYTLPKSAGNTLWNHKRTIAEVTGFVAVIYFGNKVKNAHHARSLDQLKIMRWSLKDNKTSAPCMLACDVQALSSALKPSKASSWLSKATYNCAAWIVSKMAPKTHV